MLELTSVSKSFGGLHVDVYKRQVYKDLSEKDPKFKAIHDNYMGFRDSAMPWFRLTRGAYDLSLIHIFLGVLEAHHRLAAFGHRRQGLAGFGAPGAVVARLVAAGAGRLAHGLDFLGRAVAVVGLSLIHI